MSHNSFGHLFRVTSWGESHGPAIGCVIDGCPPGLPLTEADIQPWLDRRRPGQSRFTTQRQEPDSVRILSGVFEGRTTGTPIALHIDNVDQRSRDYGDIAEQFRPGHADFTYDLKYGVRDYRGGGRASARETATRVAAGAIARRILGRVRIRGALVQMGPHRIDRARWDWEAREHNPFWCPDPVAAEAWEGYLSDVRKRGSSCGAVIELVAEHVPPGLGAPIYAKLDADLAGALMGINAVKAVEIGDGLAAARSASPPTTPAASWAASRPGSRSWRASRSNPPARSWRRARASIDMAMTSMSSPRAATTPAWEFARCRLAKRCWHACWRITCCAIARRIRGGGTETSKLGPSEGASGLADGRAPLAELYADIAVSCALDGWVAVDRGILKETAMFRPTYFLAAALMATTVLTAPLAQAATDQQQLVDRARLTIDDLKRDKEFGNARDLLHRARAIMIVPRFYKGGFFVGGEGGNGVLLTRSPNGGWSNPAFYGIGSASFGFQFGLEQSEMIMFVMSQKALNALMRNQFKVGADAGLAVVTLGSNVEGATTSAAGADIVTWASSSGAYAGISINGSIIKPELDADRAYYGHNTTTQQILSRHVTNASSLPLEQTLGGV
jgi:chorismate synthase